jgi:hypothetical protein
MHRADKAVLRLAIGTGLAVLIAYGFGMQLAFVVCLLAMASLAAPGPPTPFVKAVVTGLIVMALVAAGVLMVPLLRHYPVSAVLMTAAMLFAVFFAGARSGGSPLTLFLLAALMFTPVAGILDQALAMALAKAVGVGLVVGAAVNGISHALFPDPPQPAKDAMPAAGVGSEIARWQALQATVVVMPVFVVALTNPALYLATLMKTAMVGQQASATDARSAGRELVGSTLMGALMAAVVWFGLSMMPTLWMLALWIVAATLWGGARMFRVRPSAFAPSFWLNAIMTMFIVLGPAIEDAAVGKDPYAASATRVTLFVAVALYGWAVVWALERWRSARLATAAQPMRR